ncbi:hypothetical protein BM477_04850 [Boudabousia marimammalium]|uniref:DUF3459 domain-containing protein n=2 Tax=Boudabousia marimammalium TaxID=156892 RepID=A0A1Q5PP02_9ACTO|nr:hypothetical protein BM477_04850 [Boudabousia marimammalium]
MGAAELDWLSGSLRDYAKVGCTAILVRPSQLDFDADSTPLTNLIEKAKNTGMRTIVRVSGGGEFINGVFTESPSAFRYFEKGPEKTLERARFALQHGADGIDLGFLIAPEMDPSHESSLNQLDSLVKAIHKFAYNHHPGSIVGGFALIQPESTYQHYLDSYLFHHLRDNRLLDVAWDAKSIRDRITRTLDSRNELGQVSVWRTSSTFTDTVPQEMTKAWYQHDSGRRRRALTMLAMALPGVVYFRGNRILDLPWLLAEPSVKAMTADDIAHYRTMMTAAARLRLARGLGVGSLAWVEGAPWANRDVMVQVGTHTLTVLNTSDEVITVPSGMRPLLSSEHLVLDHTDPDSQLVRPGECAWFDAP